MFGVSLELGACCLVLLAEQAFLWSLDVGCCLSLPLSEAEGFQPKAACPFNK
jgi:hypothetical protein